MKSKILSLIFAAGIAILYSDVKAQVPSDCTAIISDFPNYTKAAGDALLCVEDIAGSVAAPLCTIGKDYPTCQALCSSNFSAHNVTCCLEALAANKVSLPTPITSVLNTVCSTIFGGLTGTLFCAAIPTTQVQIPGDGTMPLQTAVASYVGYLCCTYCSLPGNSCDVSGCLKGPTPPLQCSAFEPALNSGTCTGTTTPKLPTTKDKK